jgi:hypothetical protein
VIQHYSLMDAFTTPPSIAFQHETICSLLSSREGHLSLPQVIFPENDTATAESSLETNTRQKSKFDEKPRLDNKSEIEMKTPVPEVIYLAAHQAGLDAEAEFKGPDCYGFSWVVITPARGAFVSYLRDKKIGWKSSQGGWIVSASPYYAGAKAYAQAFAKEIAKYNINSYIDSRFN